VNFVVIANWTTSPEILSLPDSNWTGFDPITGAQISGEDFFRSQIDLLNQQMRAEDGNPVCVGDDCLRFAYRDHTYYSSSMFTRAGTNLCPKLHAIASPLVNTIGEPPLAITEDCTQATCPHMFGGPWDPFSARFAKFSDFAKVAVDECSLLTDEEALNVIIYDVCGRGAGSDRVLNTADDELDCAGPRGGRARANDGNPYIFLDYERALLPRNSATTVPSAAEEHEAGHAFGLAHACDGAELSSTPTHVMQSGSACEEEQGTRSLGFATQAHDDLGGNLVVEVDTLVQTARDHAKGWEAE
jgi:hypothetical protein